ncbi:MAG: DUF1805 domain-containing protein [Anaerovoracaceae bacterium]|jgi:uncharacterized protein YunC (DUF1805 family)
MIKVEMLDIEGKKAEAVSISEPGGAGHPNMLIVLCEKGYVMCGYLNKEASEMFGDAAVVGGGKDIAEMLKNPVKGISTAAAELGVKDGMTGAEAAAVLNR